MGGKTTNSKSTKIRMMIAGVLLICLAIVCIAGILIQGGTKVTGDYDGLKVKDALACESDLVVYPVFIYDNSDSKNIKINAIFDNEELESISLSYRLNYDSDSEIKSSEAINHAEMNKSFGKDEMFPDSLTATYGTLNDGLQFSIFAKGDDISNKILKYFMLGEVGDYKNLTKERMAKVYTSMGLNCEIRYNNDNKEVNEK